MKKLWLAIVLGAIALPVAADQFKTKDLSIVHPWARATAATSKNGAVYLKIENRGNHRERLVSASTPIADKVELHATIVEAEVTKMRPVAAIDIGAKATVSLQPRGLHVMLEGLHAPLKEGDKFPLALTFEHAGKVDIEVHVQSSPPAGSVH